MDSFSCSPLNTSFILEKTWKRLPENPEYTDSSVFVAFVSTNYAGMDECVNIFKYARLTLRKNMVVVALGESFDWKQSKIGILLADEVIQQCTCNYRFIN